MKKTLAIVLVLAVMFSMNIGGFHVHAHAEDGWTCPDCGAWARGNECWNCGFTLQPGPQFVTDDDGDAGYTPIEVGQNDVYGWTCPSCGSWCRGDECWNCGYNPGQVDTIQGWSCPTCGTWCRGEECWNCGYKPGQVEVTGTSGDIQGWNCPVCGNWCRGDECWNCGYKQGSYYFGAVTYPTNTTAASGTNASSGTVYVQDSSVAGQQITFIASKFNELKQDDSDGLWFYTVTDLDHNGLLELVATRRLDDNKNIKVKVWEVNLNGTEMVACSLPAVAPPEGQSADAYKDSFMVNIHEDVVDTYYDSANNVYYYIFVTVSGVSGVLEGDQMKTVGSGSMLTTYAAVNLKDCALKDGPLALCQSVVNEGGQLVINCRNNKAEDISMDQFVSIADTTFAGMARSNTAFDWFRADEATTVERFSNSYATFDGRLDVNESSLQTNYMTDAAGVFVSRNPTLERRAVGETASFYAYANAYDGVVWSFVSADGSQTYNAAEFMQTYGGQVSGEYSTDLKIAQVNQNMNGCSVYATFSYKGMLARTCHANLYVWQSVSQDYVTYSYGIKPNTVQRPISTIGTVYVNTVGSSSDIQGWTCPSCGVWARGNECWNCGYTLGSTTYVGGDIQGWTCPNCGSWARGNECWSCGYTLGGTTYNGGDTEGWTCPSCGSWARGDECWNCGYTRSGNTYNGGDITGWTCPDCGSWCHGTSCWNCGFTAQPGPDYVSSGTTEDIQGWYCPICGTWIRGSECWNCGYNAATGSAAYTGYNYTGDDGDVGYTPVEEYYYNYTGDDGDYGYTPVEDYYNYTGDDGDYGYTPIELEEDDIYGWTCPMCGQWVRGDECWNCGYMM